MDFEVSPRGFKYLTPITNRWNEDVRIYESSNAMEPCIWLGVAIDNHENQSVQLTLGMVDTLIEQLTWLRDHHYQVES